MKRLITILLLLFTLSISYAQRGAWWYGNAPSEAAAGPDTLTLTYWNDFIVLHIQNTGITEAGSGVSEWQDRSGNGNHATQTTDTNRPTVDGSGNVVFDGIDNYLNSTDYFSASGADSSFTIFTVIEPSAYTNSMRIIEKYRNTGSTHGFIFFIGGNAVDSIVYKQYIQDAAASSQFGDSTLANVTKLVTYAVSETTTQEIRVNGTEETSVSANPPFSGSNSGSKIGTNATASLGFFNGKILFIGIADRKFTPAEIATTETELNSFFTIY